MSALAEVIPFPSHRSHPSALPQFSVEDEVMTSNLIRMLAGELAKWRRDASASARIYFYVSFHHCPFHRWTHLLTAQETADCEELARKLEESFQYASSTVGLYEGESGSKAYSQKLNDLADQLRDMLQLIQGH